MENFKKILVQIIDQSFCSSITTSPNLTKRRSVDFFKKAVPKAPTKHEKMRLTQTYPPQKPIGLTRLDFLCVFWEREAGEKWSNLIETNANWSNVPCFHAHKEQLPTFCRGHLVTKQSKLNRFAAEFCWISGRYAENALRISIPASSNGEAPHVAL